MVGRACLDAPGDGRVPSTGVGVADSGGGGDGGAVSDSGEVGVGLDHLRGQVTREEEEEPKGEVEHAGPTAVPRGRPVVSVSVSECVCVCVLCECVVCEVCV